MFNPSFFSMTSVVVWSDSLVINKDLLTMRVGSGDGDMSDICSLYVVSYQELEGFCMLASSMKIKCHLRFYERELHYTSHIILFIILYCNVKISCNQENTTHGHLLKRLIKRQRETMHQHLVDNGPLAVFQIISYTNQNTIPHSYLNSKKLYLKQHITLCSDPLQVYK